ncbi:MAG: hypothetical protein ACYC56_14440 [Candidatus Aquicultor sp.]
MSSTSFECTRLNGFIVIKFGGILKTSNLYCLVLLIRRYLERSINTIVIDVSGELTISEEVSSLESKPLDYPDNNMKIVIIGPRENSRKFRNILSKHFV